MKNLFPILLVAAWGLLICSCDNQPKNSIIGTDHSGRDIVTQLPGQDKYVKVQDAGRFLPRWSRENTVVFHITGEPDELHPTNGSGNMWYFINNYIHRFVVTFDLENLALRPDLVKAMPEISQDELKFTYELREEPKWDNGEPISVEDIVFTFKANKCPLVNNPHAKPYLEYLQDIITYRDHPMKFTFVMKKTYLQNVAFLTDFPVIQRSYFDPDNVLNNYAISQFDNPDFDPDEHEDLKMWAKDFNDVKYSREPGFIAGLGAYQVTGWDAGQSITLTRKENHWTQQLSQQTIYETAYPEKIIFKLNRDKSSQILEFKSQTLDASVSLSTKTLLDLQKDEEFNKNYHSQILSAFSYSFLAMNMRPDGIRHKKLFTDKRVRRALALLTPVDNIISVVKKGTGKRITGPVSPLKDDYHNDLELIPYDIEEAKRLLYEAGWMDTDGDNIRDKVIDGEKVQFDFDLNYMTSQVEWKDNAQMIAESMYEAGIRANLRPLDFAILYERAENHDFDMMLGAWSGNSMPDDHKQIWHTSSWKNKGSNYTGFGNATTDALIDSINTMMDIEKRRELSRKFQQILYDAQPYVFLTASTRKIVIHKRFGNANMYFERPHVIINNLKLLSLKDGSSVN